MVRRIAWLLLLSAGVAQATTGGPTPTASQYPVREVNQVQTFFPAALDLETLAAEDQLNDELGLPPRFAVPEAAKLTPEKDGTWEDLGTGERLWRLRVLASPGATSLNFGFTRFELPKTARLLIYATDGSEILPRAFTADDNEAHGQLWTPVVRATDVILELTVSGKEVGQVALELGSVNQGYRGFGIPGAYATRSGSCNLDVECLDAADAWRSTMRAVGVISTGGSTFCTGSLVNNTANDRKMYFVTAAHCSINSGNAASLVVYWNYQNSFCRTPGSAASGAAGDGTLTQFHSGSIFRAANSPSDFTLVELDDPPVSAFNHHWAGWNRATGDFTCTAGAPCASIHHPSTDEKRITYVTVNTATTSYNSTTSPGDGTHIWAKWATDPPGPFTVPGVTEPGSSGSPLYDANRRFIGQLHGGPSACGATGNNLSDYYGRFSVSWTGGGTNATRASNWLDAGATGATTTNGIDNVACSAPPNPTGLVVTTVGETSVGLAWTATAGATGYQQHRSTINGGPYTLAGSSIGNTASVSGLACGTTHYFVVKATNAGCVSGNSNQVSATTTACSCTNVNETENNNSRTAPQVISGSCNQISGTFLNDTATGQNDYFRISVPAGRTVTALLNGLSVDYDLYLYNSTTGAAVAQSLNAGTTADTASWTNTGASAVNVFVRVYRYASTRTTYQLRVSY
jgi:lysyl endopeptidase